LSIIASSAALAISGLPFQGPIAASRVGYINNNYVLNPSKEELKESKLDLVVAGTKDAVLMVESEATGLPEKQMLDAVKFGHEKFIPVVKAIESLAKKNSRETWKIEEKDYSKLKNKISNIEKIKPQIISTGNIGCITQIAQGTKIPILHTVEIIDWYTGGPKPKILKNS